MKVEGKILYYIDEVEKGLRKEDIHPPSCEINASNACMLKCKFCIFAPYMDGSQLPYWMFENLIRSFNGNGLKSVTFTGGGEPLFNPDIQKMAEKAVDLGIQVGLVTNGVLLERITTPQIFSFIRVSVDSATPYTYEKVKGQDYFNKVIDNINRIVGRTTVGMSYVVFNDNKHELEKAAKLARDLNVSYIQFKPAWIGKTKFTDYTPPGDGKVIVTERYTANSNLPCIMAGLVGIVGADAGVYYCCQYKGDPKFKLGTLETGKEFNEIWNRRRYFNVNIEDCPHCRYMNYAAFYENAKHDLVIDHKNFL